MERYLWFKMIKGKVVSSKSYNNVRPEWNIADRPTLEIFGFTSLSSPREGEFVFDNKIFEPDSDDIATLANRKYLKAKKHYDNKKKLQKYIKNL